MLADRPLAPNRPAPVSDRLVSRSLLAYGMAALSFDVTPAARHSSSRPRSPRSSRSRGPFAFRVRPVERAHLRPFALPSAANVLAPRSRSPRRRRDRQQVPPALERQAPLQPDELRPRRDARGRRRRLGLLRPVGQRRASSRSSSPAPAASSCIARPGRTSRSRSSGRSRRFCSRARPAAPRSAHDPAPPARERRAASLRVLHDLGPEDDARFARRPDPLRRPRRARARPTSSFASSGRTARSGLSRSSRSSFR